VARSPSLPLRCSVVVYDATRPPPQGGTPVDPDRFRFIFPPVMKASDIRRGHVILIDGQPSRVMDFTHRTPGNLRAFVQLRLRNLATGNTFDTRLAATEFVDEAPLETKEFQVLYADHGGVHEAGETVERSHHSGAGVRQRGGKGPGRPPGGGLSGTGQIGPARSGRSPLQRRT